MKTILIFFAVVIGGMIYFHQALQDGSVLRYIDTHAQSQGTPEATYYIGQGYYLFQNLTEASTYFVRVAERYPDHPIGDEAAFSYLQCLDDTVGTSRTVLLAGYKAYLEKYPTGAHAETAKSRIDAYSNGSR